MNKKPGTGFVVVAIVVVTLFAGCIGEETPIKATETTTTPKETPTTTPEPSQQPAFIQPSQQSAFTVRFGLKDYIAKQVYKPTLQTPLSIVVAPDGIIYIRQSDNTVVLIDPASREVIQKTSFDSSHPVMRNFSDSNGFDRALSPDGSTYEAVWSQGVIMQVGRDGTRKPVVTGLNINDPIYLDFGPDGMLYFTDRVYTFAQVNPNGGSIKSYDFIRAAQTESLCLKDFAFEPSGDILFVSHTSGSVIRASIDDKKLQVLVPGGLNSPALAVSPDGKIFVGQTADYPIEPCSIVQLENNGTTRVIANVPGQLHAIAFGPDDILYGTSHAWYPDHNYDEFWLYRVLTNGSLQILVHHKNSPQVYQLTTLSVNPVTGDLVGFDFKSKRIVKFSSEDWEKSILGPELMYPVWSGRAVVNTDGAIWVLVVAEEGYLRGPSVNRQLFYISPKGDTKLIANLTYLNGCCTMEAMAAGLDKAAYIILGPEFDLVRVTVDGTVKLLANQLPCDPLGISVGRKGQIVFSSGDGIFQLIPKNP